MEHHPLVQSRAERPVQSVFKIKLLAVFDHVREEIAVIGGIFCQQCVEIKGAFGRDQLVEPDRAGWELSPVALGRSVIGVGATVADSLEDHASAV